MNYVDGPGGRSAASGELPIELESLSAPDVPGTVFLIFCGLPEVSQKLYRVNTVSKILISQMRKGNLKEMTNAVPSPNQLISLEHTIDHQTSLPPEQLTHCFP